MLRIRLLVCSAAILLATPLIARAQTAPSQGQGEGGCEYCDDYFEPAVGNFIHHFDWFMGGVFKFECASPFIEPFPSGSCHSTWTDDTCAYLHAMCEGTRATSSLAVALSIGEEPLITEALITNSVTAESRSGEYLAVTCDKQTWMLSRAHDPVPSTVVQSISL